MNRYVICILLLVALLSPVAHAESLFRSIGARFVIPFGEIPVTLGADVTTHVGSAIGVLAFFLSLKGDALLLASLDLPLEPNDPATCVRVTIGFYDFDPQPAMPNLVGGAGISFYGVPLGWLGYSIAGEFLYPLAFPIPTVSIAGGWVIE